jgi:predicted metal-dependent phosphoesterase TrpH
MFLSGLVLLSQAFSLPSPIRDAATLQWTTGFSIHYPIWHLIFTPFCSVADTITVLGLLEEKVIAVWFLCFCFLTGKPRRGILAFFLLLVFLAWGALIPRPMGRLVASDPDTLIIDFHSHTQYSHDGRHMFTPERNRLWHRNQGYNASFITDHNLVDAAQIAKQMSRQDWSTLGYRSLEGEEVSLQKTHLVILGNHERVNNKPYDGDVAKIQGFVADMHKKGYPVVASLPEYWLYHWGQGVQDFVNWGMDGFEIINSAPKAQDFPLQDRLQIVNLCHRQNLFMTGISDNHGYGYATAVWNAMSIPGWQKMDPDRLEKAVLDTLATKRFSAVQVLERVRYVPQSIQGLIFSPIIISWYYWRSLQPWQAISWVLWIWGFLFLCPCRKKH